MFLLAFGLAIWRLYYLLVYDGGPLDMLASLRYRLGVRFDAAGKPYGTNNFAAGLLCYYCAPLWYAVVLGTLHHFVPAVGDPLIYVLAGAAVATLVEEVRRHGQSL